MAPVLQLYFWVKLQHIALYPSKKINRQGRCAVDLRVGVLLISDLCSKRVLACLCLCLPVVFHYTQSIKLPSHQSDVFTHEKHINIYSKLSENFRQEIPQILLYLSLIMGPTTTTTTMH